MIGKELRLMKFSELINTDCFLDLSINSPEVNIKKKNASFDLQQPEVTPLTHRHAETQT